MPVKVKKSKREGCKPFVYFKGSKDELHGLETEDLTKAFDEADPKLFKSLDVQQARLKKLKADIIEKVEYLEKRSLKTDLIPLKTSKGDVALKVSIRPNGSVLIHQQPATRGSMSGDFEVLKKTLKEGFRSFLDPGDTNVEVDIDRRDVAWATGDPFVSEMTRGDRYGLEYMAPLEKLREIGAWSSDGLLRKASPQQILCLNITFADGLSNGEMEARKKFYKKGLKEFRIPIHFIKPEE